MENIIDNLKSIYKMIKLLIKTDKIIYKDILQYAGATHIDIYDDYQIKSIAELFILREKHENKNFKNIITEELIIPHINLINFSIFLKRLINSFKEIKFEFNQIFLTTFFKEYIDDDIFCIMETDKIKVYNITNIFKEHYLKFSELLFKKDSYKLCNGKININDWHINLFTNTNIADSYYYPNDDNKIFELKFELLIRFYDDYNLDNNLQIIQNIIKYIIIIYNNIIKLLEKYKYLKDFKDFKDIIDKSNEYIQKLSLCKIIDETSMHMCLEDIKLFYKINEDINTSYDTYKTNIENKSTFKDINKMILLLTYIKKYKFEKKIAEIKTKLKTKKIDYITAISNIMVLFKDTENESTNDKDKKDREEFIKLLFNSNEISITDITYDDKNKQLIFIIKYDKEELILTIDINSYTLSDEDLDSLNLTRDITNRKQIIKNKKKKDLNAEIMNLLGLISKIKNRNLVGIPSVDKKSNNLKELTEIRDKINQFMEMYNVQDYLNQIDINKLILKKFYEYVNKINLLIYFVYIIYNIQYLNNKIKIDKIILNVKDKLEELKKDINTSLLILGINSQKILTNNISEDEKKKILELLLKDIHKEIQEKQYDENKIYQLLLLYSKYIISNIDTYLKIINLHNPKKYLECRKHIGKIFMSNNSYNFFTDKCNQIISSKLDLTNSQVLVGGSSLVNLENDKMILTLKYYNYNPFTYEKLIFPYHKEKIDKIDKIILIENLDLDFDSLLNNNEFLNVEEFLKIYNSKSDNDDDKYKINIGIIIILYIILNYIIKQDINCQIYKYIIHIFNYIYLLFKLGSSNNILSIEKIISDYNKYLESDKLLFPSNKSIDFFMKGIVENIYKIYSNTNYN